MQPYEHYSNEAELKAHVTKYHGTNPVSSYLQEIVYGASDGIVTTLAVISGFAGAGSSNLELTTTVVLLFGLANLLADGTSMGLGNFLSVRSEKAVWRKQARRQIKELENNRQKAEQSTIYLLVKKGYSEADAQIIATKMMLNSEHWLQFTLEEEIGVSNSFRENSYISSLFTFVAFVTFGFLPIIPYLFSGLNNQFVLSGLFAGLSLIILGLVRKISSNESYVRSIGETLLVGGISTGIAFFVGTFFG